MPCWPQPRAIARSGWTSCRPETRSGGRTCNHFGKAVVHKSGSKACNGRLAQTGSCAPISTSPTATRALSGKRVQACGRSAAPVNAILPLATSFSATLFIVVVLAAASREPLPRRMLRLSQLNPATGPSAFERPTADLRVTPRPDPRRSAGAGFVGFDLMLRITRGLGIDRLHAFAGCLTPWRPVSGR